MAFGLGVLRLPPREFWAMTPIEIERAMNRIVRSHGIAPTRDVLGRLMTAFPDR